MPVELDVRDPHAELVPGTFCQVEWPVSRTYPTLFVPASAVASNLERTFVLRIRNNRVEWVDVKTGVTPAGISSKFSATCTKETRLRRKAPTNFATARGFSSPREFEITISPAGDPPASSYHLVNHDVIDQVETRRLPRCLNE